MIDNVYSLVAGSNLPYGYVQLYSGSSSGDYNDDGFILIT